jgi:hypothetical protein
MSSSDSNLHSMSLLSNSENTPEPKHETKHQRFQRVMDRRMTNALTELRLVSQCSSHNYEWTRDEARSFLVYLDSAVKHIAQSFGISYSTQIEPPSPKPQMVYHLEIAAAISLMDAGHLPEARGRLVSLLNS